MTAGENILRGFPFLRIIWKRIIYVILAFVVLGAAGYAYGTYVVKPTYTASTALILKMKSSDVGVSGSQATTELTLAKYYLPTVADIVVSPTAINKANEIYGGDSELVAGAVNIAYGEESLIFSLSYTDLSEEMAGAKLDALISGVKELFTANDTQSGQTFIKAKNVGITRTQNKNTIEVNSGTVKFTVLGGALGVIISVLVIFFIYKSDTTMKSKSEFEEMTGIDVLAMVNNKQTK